MAVGLGFQEGQDELRSRDGGFRARRVVSLRTLRRCCRARGGGRKGCKPTRGKGWNMKTRRVSCVGPEELPHL